MAEPTAISPPRIDIVELSTGAVVRSVKLSSTGERYVERVLMGLLRNMNTERFGAREVLK